MEVQGLFLGFAVILLCEHDTGSRFRVSISQIKVAFPFSALPLSRENLLLQIVAVICFLYQQSQTQGSWFCLGFLENAVVSAAIRTTGRKSSSPKRSWAVVGIFNKVLVPSAPLQFGFGYLGC